MLHIFIHLMIIQLSALLNPFLSFINNPNFIHLAFFKLHALRENEPVMIFKCFNDCVIDCVYFNSIFPEIGFLHHLVGFHVFVQSRSTPECFCALNTLLLVLFRLLHLNSGVFIIFFCRSCDSRNLNLSPFCEPSTRNLLVRWKEDLQTEYGPVVPDYVRSLQSPMRRRYPTTQMQKQELLTHLSKA